MYCSKCSEEIPYKVLYFETPFLIIFKYYAWASYAFNREFAINLAKTSSDNIKVHCYVSRSNESEREDAKRHGVNIITAQTIPETSDPLEWLRLPPSELPRPDIVIGHG